MPKYLMTIETRRGHEGLYGAMEYCATAESEDAAIAKAKGAGAKLGYDTRRVFKINQPTQGKKR